MKIIKSLTVENFNNKLYNQLSEDAKANAEIRQVAHYIADFFIASKYKRGIPYSRILKAHSEDSPIITDIALTELLKNLTFLYREPKTPQEKNAYGIYYPTPRTSEKIYLNSERLINKQELASTLTHELRHALDDLKSKYTAKWQDQQINQISDLSDPGQYQRYLQLSHEVNARFSQILLDIANDQDITRSNLRDKIIEHLRKNQITLHTLNPEDDPKFKKASDRYKKLYAKAASFWQQYENIKTQPQTQISIPAKPTNARVVSNNITKKPGFIQRVKDIAKNTVNNIFSKNQ
jgi:hypothetical protein